MYYYNLSRQALDDTIKKIEEFLEQNNFAGSIHFRNRGGKTYCYIRAANPQGGFSEQYISKKDAELMKKCSTAYYYKKLLPVLSKELFALNRYGELYTPMEKYGIYNSLPDTIKDYVKPMFPDIKALADKWMAAPGFQNPFRKEDAVFLTKHGEKVRSKSELIIADYLYENRDRWLYKYENGLYLPKSDKTVFPDFEVFSLFSGQVYYIEHVGLLSNPEYANAFVKKINEYAANGIILGKNLIVICESSETPLNTLTMKAIFEKSLV